MKKHLIILFLFLASCSLKRVNQHPIDLKSIVTQDVYLDDSFNDDEQNNIKYAFNEWLVATRGMVKFNYAGTIPVLTTDPYVLTKNTIIRLRSDDPFVINMRNNQVHGSSVIGFHIKTDDSIHFVVGIVYDVIPNTVQYKLNIIHELGHAINLSHIDSGPAILNTVQDKNLRCLTKTDLINFCNKYSCNAEEMNYCPNYNVSNQLFH